MEIESREWMDLIREGAEAFGVPLDENQTRLFARHARELLAWNRRVNLTRITDPREMAIRHFIDSLAPAKWIPPETKVLDIGSGAGFPGIPLKVASPALSVTLIDGVRKKVTFLKTVIRNLSLEGIEARHIRAEEMTGTDSNHAHAYGVIVCRALTGLDRFVEMALPLLAEGGSLIAMKGNLLSEERDDLNRLLDKSESPFGVEEESYRLPFEDARRTLVKISR